MTETLGSTTGGASSTGGDKTRDVAKEEAKSTAQDATQAGKQTAETAKQQAGEVVGEAKSQAQMLLGEAKDQLTSQGTAQQEKAVSGLRTLADELSGMVNGDVSKPGLASDLARQASDRVRTVADALEHRQPSELLDEVRRFARQRPGVFLLSAAAVGFIGGRLTRGIAAEAHDESGSDSFSGTSYGTGYGTTGTDYGTTGTGYVGGVASGPTVPASRSVTEGAAGTTGYSVPPAPVGDETAQFTPTAANTDLPGNRSGEGLA
ncbi:MAG: hypothetical protein QOK15_2437 [Nocardioidaceae bacterium]|jgi:hypothetical protein|nr:hypothetical protein [Nocardioidaceae bacterium]